VIKTLVTGAGGFVGSAVCSEMERRGMDHVPAVRSGRNGRYSVIGDIGPDTGWRDALRGCDAVLHVAARVHQMNDTASDAMALYRSVNVDGTINLARQAEAAGVRRFVFVSSVKVNGEASVGKPFSADDIPSPTDAYGLSKWEAEQQLLAMPRSSMEIAIVRPPLVYGPGVRANFLQLMKIVRLGFPLPFGAIDSARSLVGIDNLVDFLILCLHHPGAAEKTWMISDQRDVRLPELVRMIAAAMGKPARLLPVPPWLLTTGAGLIGKMPMMRRLTDPLLVDARPATLKLAWLPPVTMETGIRRTVQHFLSGRA
jgi:nucleoside-diphosphate-sugar epimerase